MYEHLKGKKLLIVGSAIEEEMVKAAHEMGLYVAVVDNITDRSIARAKNLADEAWDISYYDTDAIVAKCRERGIDGVFAGYGEFRVVAASRIAKALGTPFYATEEQVLATANKRDFREMCEKYDIPVPKDYARKEGLTEEEKDAIVYPVIVKASDRSGRIGISICHDRAQLDEGIEYALRVSEAGTYVVEDYLDGTEFCAVYTAKNGEISLSCLDAKYITEDQKKYNFLCDCSVAPAYFVDRFIDEVDEKIKNLLHGLGLENGMANFQGMVTDRGIYVFEMGLRINGNNDWKFIERTNGLSFMKMMMAYSLCGDMCDDLSKDDPHFKEYFCTLPIYAHEGTIAKLDISEILAQPWAEISTLNAGVGSVMVDDGTARQKVVSFLIQADDLDELKERIHFAQEKLVIEDENGNSMLFKPFNTDKLVKSV